MILPYIHYFVNNQVDGKRLLQLSHDELPSLHVTKIGHQEIILQGVELLRNIVRSEFAGALFVYCMNGVNVWVITLETMRVGF